MALRLPLYTSEAPSFVLNCIPFKSHSPLSGPHIPTFSPPQRIHRRKLSFVLAAIGKEETKLSVPSFEVDVGIKEKTDLSASGESEEDASPEDLDHVGNVKRVLDLLKKNRDMLFGEVLDLLKKNRDMLFGEKYPGGELLEKIVSGYELIHSEHIDEDALLGRCSTAISSMEKMDQEIGNDLSLDYSSWLIDWGQSRCTGYVQLIVTE